MDKIFFANQPVFTNQFLFYDTETTGNKPTEDDIISLGAVLCTYENKTFHVVDDFHSYVHTDRKIDPAAQMVHHISKHMLQGQPKFPDIMRTFKTFLTQHQTPTTRVVFVAHNGSKFDDIILYCNFVKHNMNFDNFLKDVKCHGFLDTLTYIKSLFKTCSSDEKPKDSKTGRESFALGHCFTSFCGGHALDGAHDALVDAKALYQIFNSPVILSKVSLREMLKSMVPKIKAVKVVKEKAGVAIQAREENTLKRSNPDYNDEKQPVSLTNVPIFSVNEDTASSEKGPVRLCLNCMTFVSMETHRTCDITEMPRQKEKRFRLEDQ